MKTPALEAAFRLACSLPVRVHEQRLVVKRKVRAKYPPAYWRQAKRRQRGRTTTMPRRSMRKSP